MGVTNIMPSWSNIFNGHKNSQNIEWVAGGRAMFHETSYYGTHLLFMNVIINHKIFAISLPLFH